MQAATNNPPTHSGRASPVGMGPPGPTRRQQGPGSSADYQRELSERARAVAAEVLRLAEETDVTQEFPDDPAAQIEFMNRIEETHEEIYNPHNQAVIRYHLARRDRQDRCLRRMYLTTAIMAAAALALSLYSDSVQSQSWCLPAPSLFD